MNNKRFKQAVALTVAIIAVSCFSYYSYTRHQVSVITVAITPKIKNTSIRVNNAHDMVANPESKATYMECFERLESDIKEIDKNIIDVQSVSTSSNALVTTPAVEYMKACNSLVRSMLAEVRSRLAYVNADDRSKDAERRRNSYNFDLYGEYKNSIPELNKARKKHNDAVNDLRETANKLIPIFTEVSAIFSRDALISQSVFNTFANVPVQK